MWALYFFSTMLRLILSVGVISSAPELEILVQDGDLLDPLVGGELGRGRVDLLHQEGRDLFRAGRGRPGP